MKPADLHDRRNCSQNFDQSFKQLDKCRIQEGQIFRMKGSVKNLGNHCKIVEKSSSKFKKVLLSNTAENKIS